jgi:hypothetical protein
MSLHVLYTDVDGTLVGPRGCFFAAEDGSDTLAPAEALVALHDAGVKIVLVSGRTRAQLLEVAMLLGADGYIAEMGALVCWDLGRGVQALAGEGPAAPPDLVTDMLGEFAHRLELHDPWHHGHEVDVMLRGRVEPPDVQAWLAARGFPHLRLLDNGILPRARVAGLAPGPVHVYHLMPAGIDKGTAVAADLDRRGLAPAEAVAVGDSRSDLQMVTRVGCFYLTANGARQPGLAATPGVRVTASSLGDGWAEAVRDALDAESRLERRESP